MEGNLTLAVKVTSVLCLDGAIPLLGIHPVTIFTLAENEVSTRLSTATLFVAVRVKETEMV